MIKAYSKYKPSNVKWFGGVPEHWKVVPLKRLAARYSGGTPDRSNDSYWDEGTIPWINSSEVNQKLITKPSTYITEEAYKNSSAKWIPECGLVMALAGQGKTKGMVAQVQIATTCNQSMAAIIPKEMQSSRFLFWSLESQYQEIRNMGGGDSRDGINLEIVGNIPITIPDDIVEQRSISDYLDRYTQKIDTLVAKKNEFIEKLQEKRTALISQIVTKGLPPGIAKKHGLPVNPKMKPSGVDWLGEIPNHWDFKSLKYIARAVKTGKTPPTDNQDYFDDGDIYWFGPADFDEDIELTGSTKKISKLAIEDNAAPIFEADQVLLVSIGATLGKVAVFKKLFSTNQQINVILPNKSTDSIYLAFYLRAFKELIFNWANTATMPILNQDKAKQLPCIVPPTDEQRVIGSYLRSECDKIKSIIAKTESAVALLTEYRSALITSAVTGKIDVRGMSK